MATDDDEAVDLDADEMNADWLRTMSWDIWLPGHTKLVETLDELIYALAPMTLAHFIELPAALAMPQSIVDEIMDALRLPR